MKIFPKVWFIHCASWTRDEPIKSSIINLTFQSANFKLAVHLRVVSNFQSFNCSSVRYHSPSHTTLTMLPTKWAEAKREDPRPGDASPTESIVHPAAPGSGSALEKSTHTDSKHTHQARTQVLTPPDRQRTAQACDKCRERKTKASVPPDVRQAHKPYDHPPIVLGRSSCVLPVHYTWTYMSVFFS